jgi:hypothetical protein
MAVSGKTTKLEWPYFLGTDKPPDMAAVTKAQADRAEALLVGTAGQLLIVQNTGAPAAKAMKGDATLAEDGMLTIGAAKVTDAKLAKPPIAGEITAGGEVGVGSGFAAEKTATGTYKITLTTELSTEGVIVVTALESVGVRFGAITESGKKVFRVSFYKSFTEKADTPFLFYIRAPS